MLRDGGKPNAALPAAAAAAFATPAWSRFGMWESEPTLTRHVCHVSKQNYGLELKRTIALLDAIHDDGLSRAEREFRTDCLASLEMPDAMAKHDAKIIKKILSSTDTKLLYKTSFSGWLGRKNWLTQTIATSEFRRREIAAQAMADTVRKAYGLEPIPVHFMNLPKKTNLIGHYVPRFDGKPAIIINAAGWANVIDSPQTLLPVLLEETRHSIDHAAMSALKNGKLSPDDPNYYHAAMIAMNLQPAAYVRTGNGGNRSAYENQYVERTAKAYAADLTQGLLEIR
jgi:hypothetical protein